MKMVFFFLVPYCIQPVYLGSAFFFLIFNEFIYLSKKKKKKEMIQIFQFCLDEEMCDRR